MVPKYLLYDGADQVQVNLNYGLKFLGTYFNSTKLKFFDR